jgi:L-amino acid N-acyltransferase YncA
VVDCRRTERLSSLTTRTATIDDAVTIASIYNEGIADRIATFETEPRSAEQIAALLRERGTRYPTGWSRIFPENTASLALHERCGFRVVGVYRRHGNLDGEWRDCVIVERLLEEQP